MIFIDEATQAPHIRINKLTDMLGVSKFCIEACLINISRYSLGIVSINQQVFEELVDNHEHIFNPILVKDIMKAFQKAAYEHAILGVYLDQIPLKVEN